MRSASSAASASAVSARERGPVGQLGAALEPERLGVARERLRQACHDRGAIGGQRDAVARELRVPGRERAAPRTAGTDRRQQGVALPERGRVGAAGGDAGRPQRGDHLVDVGPPQRRRAQHQLEAVGQEDGDERPRGGVRQAVDGGAVDLQPLGLARLEADRDPVRLAVALRVELEPRRPRRRSARPRARWPSGTSDRCRRSRSPPAGSSCRHRSGP